MPKETQMKLSDFNLQKINTKQLEDHIASSISIGSNIAIFGRRGTGKTHIAKQQIEKIKHKEIYLNLSVLERVDLGGYPNIMAANLKNKFVDFLMPSFYEYLLDGDQPVVALLDEVDKADPSLWAPLLEFTQFKSINGVKMKNLKSVIMTGNLISEGGTRPSLPLLDRTEKYLVESDIDSFIEWAGKTRSIHPAMIAYLLDNPKDLYGAPDPEDRYSDPSPRGWHNASNITSKGEEIGWNFELLLEKVSGCIGKDAGMRYAHYYQHYQKLLPLIDRLFKGENIASEFNKLETSQQLVGAMIVCTRFSNLLTKSQIGILPESAKYVSQFLHSIPLETVLLVLRTQITVKNIMTYKLDDDPLFKDLFNKVLEETKGSKN